MRTVSTWLILCCALWHWACVWCKDGCRVTGNCVLCSSAEMQEPFCIPTGRRQEVSCPNAATHEVDDLSAHRAQVHLEYKSCETTAKDELTHMLAFQVIMALAGGLAMWGVQIRKRGNMSQYEHRRDRQRNTAF